MTILRIDEASWDGLQTYLDHSSERMAFLAATPTSGTDQSQEDWTAVGVLYLDDEADYASQGWEGVELADHIRPRTLKWSTELNAALIEIHSHGVGRWATTFSTTDLRGLAEITPSLLWRLNGRPYGALVVGGRIDHDSLWWSSKDSGTPSVVQLVIGTTITQSTGLALDRLAKLQDKGASS